MVTPLFPAYLPFSICPPKCILGHLQSCSVRDPAKIFFTSKFSYLLFWNFAQKTEIGGGPATANCKNDAEPKLDLEPNRHMLTFLHPILLCRITY